MLLPSGFYDVIAPDAAIQAQAVETLMQSFAQYGYTRVAPPLMEFEESLLAGPGATLNRSTFRVMDAASQRMLGLRTDHTLQIGRIAATRLYDLPRPLRLSYAGPVLRAIAGEHNPARQLGQVGVELIGSLAPEADAEALQLALYALGQLGLEDITVDLLLPTLIPALCDAHGLDADTRKALHDALDRKDEAMVRQLGQGTGGKTAQLALHLLRASGNAETALAALNQMELPENAQADRARLNHFMAVLDKNITAPLTLDLVEFRGLEYQTGLSFALFSKSSRTEIARGGRYRTATDEASTGFTFYIEALMSVLPADRKAQRVLVPFNLAAAQQRKLIDEGYVLVQALDAGTTPVQQAKEQHCALLWQDGKVISVSET